MKRLFADSAAGNLEELLEAPPVVAADKERPYRHLTDEALLEWERRIVYRGELLRALTSGPSIESQKGRVIPVLSYKQRRELRFDMEVMLMKIRSEMRRRRRELDPAL